jgi:hypothetical protein
MVHDPDDPGWGDRVERPLGQEATTKRDLWKRIASRLCKKTIPAAIQRRVPMPADIPDEDFDSYLNTTRLELLNARIRRASARATSDSVAFMLNNGLRDDERLRESVLAAELGRLASRYMETRDDATGTVIPGRVAGLRTTIFGSLTATPRRAVQVLLSPAASFLDSGFFQRERVPVVAVGVVVHGRSWGAYPANRQRWEGIDLECTWGAKTIRDTLQIPVRDGFVELLVRADPGLPLPIRCRVAKMSVLAEVQKLASELAAAYLWHEADAAWFILSGEAPSTPCFRVEVRQGTGADNRQVRLNLSVQPWVSAKTVNRVYRHYQQIILGRENRHPKVESLRFMDFVASWLHRGSSWESIMKEWNRRHPRQQYKAREIGNFKRDFQNIHRLVLWARYDRDKWERDVLKLRRR